MWIILMPGKEERHNSWINNWSKNGQNFSEINDRHHHTSEKLNEYQAD